MLEQSRLRSRLGWLRRPRNRHVRLKGKGLLSLRRDENKKADDKPKNPRRWRGLTLVGVALGTAALVGGAHYGVMHAPHFLVTTISFSPTRHVSAESLQRRVAGVLGENIWRVDAVTLEQQLLREPWLAAARVRFELPATVRIEVTEREASGVVALDSLYLSDANGQLFKRATVDEAAELPIITGLLREQYSREQLRSKQQIKEALQLYATWKASSKRAPIGEVHIDRTTGFTVFTEDGVGIRLGILDQHLDERLRRVDTVLAELRRRGEQPKMIYADNRSRPDRISVRLRGQPGIEPNSEKAS